MTDNEIFTPDFREVSFWIDDAREPGQTRAEPAPLPARADVVVIGGGLTGTAAACELARGGRDTVVLDAAEPGEGASSRNAGMLGWHSKHYFTELQEKVGIDEATRFYRELRQIYEITVKRIHDEKIDCGFRKCGRFLGALS
ncbi:MAG: FAD-binding oxidoreductase, partial [Alphaproteobacteria bacterium]|nr:FAD-binding oxidoreductase [Alphaproteobacteria bacterium]